MTFREYRDSLPPDAHCVPNCPFMYGLESKFESEGNCESNGGKGCKYCWDREMPEVKTPDKAEQAKAVRMPKLTTGTKLQLIDIIISNCYESMNFHEQPYLNGIIDAVCSVISFEVEDND